MNKKVITNDEAKINIVILRNEKYGIEVKGISKCHPDDTYDKDLGLYLANSRAWIKYYKMLNKAMIEELDCGKLFLDRIQKELGIIEETIQNNEAKLKLIEEDYTNKIKGI